jgi:predicted GNAT family N-acyltransferase
MITAYPITEPHELEAAFAIRRTVFVEGQGVPLEAEYDEHDRTDAHHYLAHTADGTPCGAARWRKTSNGVKLERFAVLADYRNQTAGAALLQSVLQDVQAAYPDAQVYLHAQLPAVRFYERHGFVREGEKFSECDIEHFKMVWMRPWLTNS